MDVVGARAQRRSSRLKIKEKKVIPQNPIRFFLMSDKS